MKKLLMLGTSYASCEMVKYAKSIGVYTIVTDPMDPSKSLAKQVADEYWMLNTGDIDALEARCREEGVTAVCCGISEFNLEVTMELCKRLGLKAYCTPDAWRYSRDKDLFKKLCREINAPIAKDYFISKELTDEELDQVVFPVVVKPVDLSGNRGITYCYSKEELREAYRYALSVSKRDKIIVERMLHGEEWYSTYAFANGQISLIALNAMYAQPGEPKNCYTVTTTVSNHVKQYLEELNPVIEELLRRVGCTDGIAWVQAMLDEDGQFYIIEMGYRMDGEMMIIPYKDLCGFDTIKWLVETALGIEHTVEDLPKPQTEAFTGCACGMELWTNKSGKICEMIGFEEMAKVPGVFVETLKQVGDEIIKYRPVGVITFATGNCEQMCELIDMVNRTVRVLNEDGEDVVIKYTDFDYLRRMYEEGLAGR